MSENDTYGTSVIVLNQEAVEKGALTTFNTDTQNLIEQCGRVVVIDHDSFGKVGALVKIGNGKLKELDEARLAETQKPRDYTTWINAKFKDITDPLKAALREAGDKAKTWADAEERRRQEEERIAREKADREAIARAEAQAEEERKAREVAAQAAKREADAKADGDEERAELARQQQHDARRLAEQHATESEKVLDEAANMPEADTTVRKVRSSFGTTASMRKTLKFEVCHLGILPEVFVHAIMNSENALKYMRIAIDKDPAAKAYFEEKIKGKAERALKEFEQVSIGGLVLKYDKTFTAR